MTHEIFLEIGKKKTFAGSIEWPGWCRGAKDEPGALQALIDYAPRYARVLAGTDLGFKVPADISAFEAVERFQGGAATDFGAPAAVPAADADAVDSAQLGRFEAILLACWRAFDEAAAGALGRELRKGPRGGGRDLDKIVRHVIDADQAYLRKLGWKYKKTGQDETAEELANVRDAILGGLAAKVRGELPAEGPRGGLRWPARYFVRRVAWHVLDHAWEIEDRVVPIS